MKKQTRQQWPVLLVIEPDKDLRGLVPKYLQELLPGVPVQVVLAEDSTAAWKLFQEYHIGKHLPVKMSLTAPAIPSEALAAELISRFKQLTEIYVVVWTGGSLQTPPRFGADLELHKDESVWKVLCQLVKERFTP